MVAFVIALIIFRLSATVSRVDVVKGFQDNLEGLPGTHLIVDDEDIGSSFHGHKEEKAIGMLVKSLLDLREHSIVRCGRFYPLDDKVTHPSPLRQSLSSGKALMGHKFSRKDGYLTLRRKSIFCEYAPRQRADKNGHCRNKFAVSLWSPTDLTYFAEVASATKAGRSWPPAKVDKIEPKKFEIFG